MSRTDADGARIKGRAKRRTASAAARIGAVLAAGLLAGCGGGAGGLAPADQPLGQFLRGTTEQAEGLDPEEFRPVAACPTVELLPNTETVRRTRGGNEFEEGTLVWQARIDETARECVDGEDGVRVRVGIAGRALSGPEGPAGTVRLPIRVAVREGDAVTYSKLHRVEVELTAGEPARNFAFVDEAVPVADRETAEIIVGFDDRD